MTVVLSTLRTWRHYLLGVVRTDNIATSYFQTQKKLSPKQARWQDFLAEFDMCIEYKPGRTNLVAGALSRKAELVSLKLQEITAVSQFRSTLSDRIKEGLQYDAVARSLLQSRLERPRFFGKGWSVLHQGE